MSFLTELRRRNVFRVGIAYSVTAWLVAQVAELAFESFGTPDWVMKTLLFLLVIGLVFAVIFAWAFELTPEGIKREKDVDRSQSITHETGRKLNYTIIGVLAVALVFSVVTHRWTTGDPSPTKPAAEVAVAEKSIAVLPFVNMSDDPNNEYFSDGISEELLNVLVKVDGLRVASRTSSFSFKGSGTPIPQIADALNVEHVLEGSVRKAGDTVRITAQLIDVKTDSHLWSDTYDRKLEDIFVIQDEISAHIVESLKIALGAGEIVQSYARPTDNLEAYEDYLRGRHFWQLRGEDNIRKAIELFSSATEADPQFARAWSSIAAAHITLPTYSMEPIGEHHLLAEQYARKALELDPTIADAHAVLGDIHRGRYQWQEAERHYLKAIELEPRNSTSYLWYAEHLACVGRAKEARKYALRSLGLDPFNAGVNSVVGMTHELNGDFDQARRSIEAAGELGHPTALINLMSMELSRGHFDRAQAIAERIVSTQPPEIVQAMSMRVAAFQDPELVDEYMALVSSDIGPGEFMVALEYLRLGQIEEATSRIRDMAVIGNLWAVLWMPMHAELRRTPVFEQMLVRDGIVDYWDNTGWPEQCSREAGKITCR